jgi:hypothetical protein
VAINFHLVLRLRMCLHVLVPQEHADLYLYLLYLEFYRSVYVYIYIYIYIYM